MCSVCPVNLSKPGLSYDDESGAFRNRIRDWVVDMPEAGFLFPAFTDRSTDIHSTLYYTKDASDIHADFIDGMFHTAAPDYEQSVYNQQLSHREIPCRIAPTGGGMTIILQS